MVATELATTASRPFPPPAQPQAVPTFSPWEPIFASGLGDAPRVFVDQFLRSPSEPFTPLAVGWMTRVWHRPRWLGPVFRLLARHGVLVAGAGNDIAMTLEMIPRWDTMGRPYNVCARRFDFPDPARFDTLKTWDGGLQRLVEYVGRGRHLFVVWRTTRSGQTIAFETERIAIIARRRRLWLPAWLWKAFVGRTLFTQTAKPDGHSIEISLVLTSSLLGDVFGYEGTFEVRRSDDPLVRP